MNNEDTRNLFLAIALSVLVMAAWQYFYAGPLYQQQHQAQTQTQTNVTAPQSTRNSRPRRRARRMRRASRRPAAPRLPARSRPRPSREALAANPRVAIDTPSLGGSIDLKGGKLDDLVLKDYHETIAKRARWSGSSRRAARRTPIGPTAGYISAGGAKTPTLDTVWTAAKTR